MFVPSGQNGIFRKTVEDFQATKSAERPLAADPTRKLQKQKPVCRSFLQFQSVTAQNSSTPEK